MTDNRTTHTGEQLQRPVNKVARAKHVAAQAKRLAKYAAKVRAPSFEDTGAAQREWRRRSNEGY